MGHPAAWWYFNHQNYVAQTFDAASYGLTEVGYPRALYSMPWKSSAPAERGWLEAASNGTSNLYLGQRWLADKGYFLRADQLKAYHTEERLLAFVSEVLCPYNTGYPQPTCHYANRVISKAMFYLPQQGQ